MIKKDWTDEDKLRGNNLLKCILKLQMWEKSQGSDAYVLGASIIWLKELIEIMETPVVSFPIVKPKEEKDMPARIVQAPKGDKKNGSKKKATHKKTRKSPPSYAGKGTKST